MAFRADEEKQSGNLNKADSEYWEIETNNNNISKTKDKCDKMWFIWISRRKRTIHDDC